MKQPVLFGNGGGGGSWFQTIAVTAPIGATISVSGGGETLTATGTGTYYAFAVHNQSTTYSITATMDGESPSAQTVTTGTTSGVISFVEIKFGTINVTLSSDFIGLAVTCSSGGTTITKTPSTTSLTFRVPDTGTWTIASSVGGTPYSTTATITDIDVPVSASLQTSVTLTVDMYGAGEAVITWTNEDGTSGSATMDSSGHNTANIIIQNGGNITFTDTTVAKDLDVPANDFTRTINVTNATTTIYVMPVDDCMYWYGYVGSGATLSGSQKSQQYGGGPIAITKTEDTTDFHIYANETSDGFGTFTLQMSTGAIDFSAISSVHLITEVAPVGLSQGTFWLPMTTAPITSLTYVYGANYAPETTPATTYCPQLTGGNTEQIIDTSTWSETLYLHVGGSQNEQVHYYIRALWTE